MHMTIAETLRELHVRQFEANSDDELAWLEHLERIIKELYADRNAMLKVAELTDRDAQAVIKDLEHRLTHE